MNKISLIICTYMRPKAIIKLLDSVNLQNKYPEEILIIDGSLNNETKKALSEKNYNNLKYFLVDKNNRGLTKQRNFGISKLSDSIDIVAFLDDDTILREDYFEVLAKTYQSDSDIVGVGANPFNFYKWEKKQKNKEYSNLKFYHFEGYVFKEGLRNVARKVLKLQTKLSPAVMPEFSHGRSCGYPKTGKTYEVDLLTGFSFSFAKRVTDLVKFSNYFEGYGLYEDADYSLRAKKYGKNVVNTNLYIDHLIEPEGRPNKLKFGKMVVRNGWYVWRIKYPKPNLKNRFKWNAIILLLLIIRFTNVFTTKDKKAAFTESLGRLLGLLSLLFKKPRFK